MLRKTLTSWLFVLLIATTASAQGNIFLVRHAERADTAGGAAPMMATDPNLSDAGRQRAESLAAILKDAGITSIYTTEFKQASLNVTHQFSAGLVQKLKSATANVLVVGHSNTVPEIVKALGITTPLKIEDAEYDNLLIVPSVPQPQLIRLRYR